MSWRFVSQQNFKINLPVAFSPYPQQDFKENVPSHKGPSSTHMEDYHEEGRAMVLNCTVSYSFASRWIALNQIVSNRTVSKWGESYHIVSYHIGLVVASHVSLMH